MTSRANQPILTAPLFEELDGKLLALLESLDDEDWRRRTVVPRWDVTQIAAHLLDTALRRLSLDRDRASQPAPAPIDSSAGLRRLVDDLNARGVAVYGALSSRMIVSLMRVATRELREHFLSLDPLAPAAWAVSWAGEHESPNWFDTAREFTERWHHQQQIRLAVGRAGITTPALYGPVLDCFMRALPYAYRDVPAAAGDAIRVCVDGDCGGEWRLRRDGNGWQLVDDIATARVVASTTIPQDLAWQIFTKAVAPAAARTQVTIDGNEDAGAAVLRMIAIVG
jgi:uncharacterized protein (TIGR03083 family)